MLISDNLVLQDFESSLCLLFTKGGYFASSPERIVSGSVSSVLADRLKEVFHYYYLPNLKVGKVNGEEEYVGIIEVAMREARGADCALAGGDHLGFWTWIDKFEKPSLAILDSFTRNDISSLTQMLDMYPHCVWSVLDRERYHNVLHMCVREDRISCFVLALTHISAATGHGSDSLANPCNQTDWQKNTPLMLACQLFKCQYAQLLLNPQMHAPGGSSYALSSCPEDNRIDVWVTNGAGRHCLHELLIAYRRHSSSGKPAASTVSTVLEVVDSLMLVVLSAGANPHGGGGSGDRDKADSVAGSCDIECASRTGTDNAVLVFLLAPDAHGFDCLDYAVASRDAVMINYFFGLVHKNICIHHRPGASSGGADGSESPDVELTVLLLRRWMRHLRHLVLMAGRHTLLYIPLKFVFAADRLDAVLDAVQLAASDGARRRASDGAEKRTRMALQAEGLVDLLLEVLFLAANSGSCEKRTKNLNMLFQFPVFENILNLRHSRQKCGVLESLLRTSDYGVTEDSGSGYLLSCLSCVRSTGAVTESSDLHLVPVLRLLLVKGVNALLPIGGYDGTTGEAPPTLHADNLFALCAQKGYYECMKLLLVTLDLRSVAPLAGKTDKRAVYDYSSSAVAAMHSSERMIETGFHNIYVPPHAAPFVFNNTASYTSNPLVGAVVHAAVTNSAVGVLSYHPTSSLSTGAVKSGSDIQAVPPACCADRENAGGEGVNLRRERTAATEPRSKVLARVRPECLEYLLEYSSFRLLVNYVDVCGNTPLLVACQCRDAAAVELLLRYGALPWMPVPLNVFRDRYNLSPDAVAASGAQESPMYGELCRLVELLNTLLLNFNSSQPDRRECGVKSATALVLFCKSAVDRVRHFLQTAKEVKARKPKPSSSQSSGTPASSLFSLLSSPIASQPPQQESVLTSQLEEFFNLLQLALVDTEAARKAIDESEVGTDGAAAAKLTLGSTLLERANITPGLYLDALGQLLQCMVSEMAGCCGGASEWFLRSWRRVGTSSLLQHAGVSPQGGERSAGDSGCGEGLFINRTYAALLRGVGDRQAAPRSRLGRFLDEASLSLDASASDLVDDASDVSSLAHAGFVLLLETHRALSLLEARSASEGKQPSVGNLSSADVAGAVRHIGLLASMQHVRAVQDELFLTSGPSLRRRGPGCGAPDACYAAHGLLLDSPLQQCCSRTAAGRPVSLGVHSRAAACAEHATESLAWRCASARERHLMHRYSLQFRGGRPRADQRWGDDHAASVCIWRLLLQAKPRSPSPAADHARLVIPRSLRDNLSVNEGKGWWFDFLDSPRPSSRLASVNWALLLDVITNSPDVVAAQDSSTIGGSAAGDVVVSNDLLLHESAESVNAFIVACVRREAPAEVLIRLLQRISTTVTRRYGGVRAEPVLLPTTLDALVHYSVVDLVSVDLLAAVVCLFPRIPNSQQLSDSWSAELRKLSSPTVRRSRQPSALRECPASARALAALDDARPTYWERVNRVHVGRRVVRSTAGYLPHRVQQVRQPLHELTDSAPEPLFLSERARSFRKPLFEVLGSMRLISELLELAVATEVDCADPPRAEASPPPATLYQYFTDLSSMAGSLNPAFRSAPLAFTANCANPSIDSWLHLLFSRGSSSLIEVVGRVIGRGILVLDSSCHTNTLCSALQCGNEQVALLLLQQLELSECKHHGYIQTGGSDEGVLVTPVVGTGEPTAGCPGKAVVLGYRVHTTGMLSAVQSWHHQRLLRAEFAWSALNRAECRPLNSLPSNIRGRRYKPTAVLDDLLSLVRATRTVRADLQLTSTEFFAFLASLQVDDGIGAPTADARPSAISGAARRFVLLFLRVSGITDLASFCRFLYALLLSPLDVSCAAAVLLASEASAIGWSPSSLHRVEFTDYCRCKADSAVLGAHTSNNSDSRATLPSNDANLLWTWLSCLHLFIPLPLLTAERSDRGPAVTSTSEFKHYYEHLQALGLVNSAELPAFALDSRRLQTGVLSSEFFSHLLDRQVLELAGSGSEAMRRGECPSEGVVLYQRAQAIVNEFMDASVLGEVQRREIHANLEQNLGTVRSIAREMRAASGGCELADAALVEMVQWVPLPALPLLCADTQAVKELLGTAAPREGVVANPSASYDACLGYLRGLVQKVVGAALGAEPVLRHGHFHAMLKLSMKQHLRLRLLVDGRGGGRVSTQNSYLSPSADICGLIHSSLGNVEALVMDTYRGLAADMNCDGAISPISQWTLSQVNRALSTLMGAAVPQLLSWCRHYLHQSVAILHREGSRAVAAHLRVQRAICFGCVDSRLWRYQSHCCSSCGATASSTLLAVPLQLATSTGNARLVEAVLARATPPEIVAGSAMFDCILQAAENGSWSALHVLLSCRYRANGAAPSGAETAAGQDAIYRSVWETEQSEGWRLLLALVSGGAVPPRTDVTLESSPSELAYLQRATYDIYGVDTAAMPSGTPRRKKLHSDRRKRSSLALTLLLGLGPSARQMEGSEVAMVMESAADGSRWCLLDWCAMLHYWDVLVATLRVLLRAPAITAPPRPTGSVGSYLFLHQAASSGRYEVFQVLLDAFEQSMAAGTGRGVAPPEGAHPGAANKEPPAERERHVMLLTLLYRLLLSTRRITYAFPAGSAAEDHAGSPTPAAPQRDSATQSVLPGYLQSSSVVAGRRSRCSKREVAASAGVSAIGAYFTSLGFEERTCTHSLLHDALLSTYTDNARHHCSRAPGAAWSVVQKEALCVRVLQLTDLVVGQVQREFRLSSMFHAVYAEAGLVHLACFYGLDRFVCALLAVVAVDLASVSYVLPAPLLSTLPSQLAPPANEGPATSLARLNIRLLPMQVAALRSAESATTGPQYAHAGRAHRPFTPPPGPGPGPGALRCLRLLIDRVLQRLQRRRNVGPDTVQIERRCLLSSYERGAGPSVLSGDAEGAVFMCFYLAFYLARADATSAYLLRVVREMFPRSYTRRAPASGRACPTDEPPEELGEDEEAGSADDSGTLLCKLLFNNDVELWKEVTVFASTNGLAETLSALLRDDLVPSVMRASSSAGGRVPELCQFTHLLHVCFPRALRAGHGPVCVAILQHYQRAYQVDAGPKFRPRSTAAVSPPALVLQQTPHTHTFHEVMRHMCSARRGDGLRGVETTRPGARALLVPPARAEGSKSSTVIVTDKDGKKRIVRIK